MKNILITVSFFLITKLSFGQSNIQLTVKWNSTLSRYEVYTKPAFTQSNFTLGASQITVVVPSSVANSPLTIASSVGGGTWTAGIAAFAPNGLSNDFHSITSAGGTLNLTNGTESMLFTFTLPGTACADGVRLFVNNSDPSSSAPGMSGNDFRTSLEASTGVEFYQSNYNNTGTQCIVCNITAPELSKQ